MANLQHQMQHQMELHTHIPSSSNHNNNNVLTNIPPTRPKSESKAEVARLRQIYRRFVDDLLEWSSAQENLDVYQMNAFYAATHEMRYYWRNYWKTICVQFIQTAGLGILLYHDWFVGTVRAELNIDIEEDTTKKICAADGPLDLKLLGFFLLSFLSIRLSDQIATMADYGMYSWGQFLDDTGNDDDKSMNNKALFVNWGWIFYGLMVNYITLVSSFFISGLVVYNCETPLDMILDFVALYFIIELDDEMVTFNDFQDIEQWLKGNDNDDDEEAIKNHGFGDSPYEVWLYNVAVGNDQGLSAGVVDDDGDGYADNNVIGRCGSCWNKCGKDCLQKFSKCRDPRKARNLMLPLVILMPLYVLICF